MVGGGGGALVSCKRRLASPPHPDRRPVALPPSSFQSPALLRAQESWFTQCLGAFEAGYWNFNPSFPFIPDPPAPSAMVCQVPPFPRPQQTLKANLGGGLLIQPSSALRVRDCPLARLGWSGGVMVGATGQGSISLTQCHPSGCMRPWHSGPRLPSSLAAFLLAFVFQHAGVSGVALRMQSPAWHWGSRGGRGPRSGYPSASRGFGWPSYPLPLFALSGSLPHPGPGLFLSLLAPLLSPWPYFCLSLSPSCSRSISLPPSLNGL